jgi:hypothetical protein
VYCVPSGGIFEKQLGWFDGRENEIPMKKSAENNVVMAKMESTHTTNETQYEKRRKFRNLIYFQGLGLGCFPSVWRMNSEHLLVLNFQENVGYFNSLNSFSPNK